jgi:hypothetical protein
MAKDTLRSGQLVTTFGPGAMVDLPDDAVIVAGLDQWQYDKGEPLPLIEEPRLLAVLRQQLENPPNHFRRPPVEKDREEKFAPHVTAWRFPEWYVVQRAEPMTGGGKRRRLVPQSQLDGGKFRDDHGKRQAVVPVRFVLSCNKGHVDDIDWRAFLHPDDKVPCTHPMWMEERGTSGTLADTWIVCGCKKERSMSQAAMRDLRALGSCRGRRPWLGPASKEPCGEGGRLLIRSASNAYFPQIVSAISIPDTSGALVGLVGKLWEKGLNLVGTGALPLANARQGIAEIGASLADYSDQQVNEAIAAFQGGSSGTQKPLKTAEFEAFLATEVESGADTPDGDFYARSLPESAWKVGKPWMSAFSKIVLVHRLREVVTQVGFTRFEAAVPELTGELDLDVKPQVLSRNADWLPAVENRGEGIFLEFDQARIAEWMQRSPVAARADLLAEGFSLKFTAAQGKSPRPFYGAPFYMVHSFSHLLMTRIALECGYPSSSIRERVYADGGKYGLLIYTGSSDAEGTLGGLVQAGGRISDIVRLALCFAEICSNDPVCAAQKPNHELQRELLGAACHGCLLVAETSCEHRNCFLDRPLVVRTVDDDKSAFFRDYAV